MHILSILVAVLAAPAPPPKPCTGPESRQFDFWVGDWDLKVRARSAPDKDEWGTANATQKIEAILGGCQPTNLTASRLMQDTRIPTDWQDQRRALGFV